MNDKNIDFYRKINIDKFKEIAHLIGLDTAVDIGLIYPYIQSSKVLVELGAGYGRVIRALIEKQFRGKIIAFERSPELMHHLKTQFENPNFDQKLTLIESDFKHFSLPTKADAVLWLWSGFLELSEDEQAKSVKHISNHLTENGVLVIEIPVEVKHIGTRTDHQHIKVETDWGTMDAYLPRYEELLTYAEKSGFEGVERIDYATATQLKRSVYIFRK
jgi:SAM-dependent methyltransferase